MTVCIATLFQWNYASKDTPAVGTAALVLTDRMITAGDVQYEPRQTKIAHITPTTLLVIAGDYSLHSTAHQADCRAISKLRAPRLKLLHSFTVGQSRR